MALRRMIYIGLQRDSRIGLWCDSAWSETFEQIEVLEPCARLDFRALATGIAESAWRAVVEAFAEQGRLRGQAGEEPSGKRSVPWTSASR